MRIICVILITVMTNGCVSQSLDKAREWYKTEGKKLVQDELKDGLDQTKEWWKDNDMTPKHPIFKRHSLILPATGNYKFKPKTDTQDFAQFKSLMYVRNIQI